MALLPNPGECPEAAVIRNDEGEPIGFRRVRAVLFGGYDTAKKEPSGWPAGGKGGCSWRISSRPHPFEIKEYEVI